MKSWSIYSLTDPITGDIRYVGRTTQNIHRRLRQHLAAARQAKLHRHVLSWLQCLMSEGLEPSIAVFESGNGDWDEAERFWIKKLRDEGANLTNHTDGGEGDYGFVRSVETRKKLSVACRGWKHSAEAKVKISEAARGNRWNLGRRLSSETKKKVSEGNKGRVRSPEECLKISMAKLGHVVSPDTRDKIRMALLGKPRSISSIMKTSASNTGRKRTQEQRLRMSAAQKKRFSFDRAVS